MDVIGCRPCGINSRKAHQVHQICSLDIQHEEWLTDISSNLRTERRLIFDGSHVYATDIWVPGNHGIQKSLLALAQELHAQLQCLVSGSLKLKPNGHLTRIGNHGTRHAHYVSQLGYSRNRVVLNASLNLSHIKEIALHKLCRIQLHPHHPGATGAVLVQRELLVEIQCCLILG